MSKSEPKCRKETARNIEWSETQSGRTAHKNCPAGTGGNYMIFLHFWERKKIISLLSHLLSSSFLVILLLRLFGFRMSSNIKNQQSAFLK